VGVLGINHIAFRTPDPARLRGFYAELLGAESLEGSHEPLRAGATLLVFFSSQTNTLSDDPDEIAFDVDAAGFDETLERARQLGAIMRDPVAHTSWSKGFYVQDPDGRRIEITYDDRGIYWLE
jgi:catechol 2,3-dioxygenase-like lactoylglutathione lyase family enzyme